MNISNINRRGFLRGFGACVALPAMEAFLPGRAMAATGSVCGIRHHRDRCSAADGLPVFS